MLGVLFSFFAYTSFAFMDVVNKFLFATENIPFFSYMLWLDLAIIIALIIYLIIKKHLSLAFFKSTHYKALFIRSALSVLNTLCSLLAISHLPFHLFYTLAFLQPIIATFFALALFLEKPNWLKISTIIGGFIGILIAIEVWQNTLSFHILGLIGGLGIPITGALSGIVVKKYMPQENTTKITFYNVLLSILVAAVYFIITQDAVYIPSNFKTSTLIFAAGILACLGMVFFMRSYQSGAVQNIAIMQYTQIIWGVLFGYLLFSTIPSIYSIIGLLIIISCSILSLRFNNK